MKSSNSKTTRVSKPKQPSNKTSKKVDINKLNESFNEVHRTRMTKNAAEARKTCKIVPVKGKLVVPSRETVNETSDEIANLLKNFK